MTIETLRGRYRLHRFPPRTAVTGEPLTLPGISAADYQRQLMDGFQEGLQKVLLRNDRRSGAELCEVNKVLPEGATSGLHRAALAGQAGRMQTVC